MTIIVTTYPIIAGEIESGSPITITFNDGDYIKGKQILVTPTIEGREDKKGIERPVVGNQVNWTYGNKGLGPKVRTKITFVLVWENTDGSSGRQLLPIYYKAKEEEVVENWYVPTGGNNPVGGGILIGDVDVGDIEPKRTPVDDYLDLYEKYVIAFEKGDDVKAARHSIDAQAADLGFHKQNPGCIKTFGEKNLRLRERFNKGQINNVGMVAETAKLRRSLYKCIGWSDLQITRYFELEQRGINETIRRQKK